MNKERERERERERKKERERVSELNIYTTPGQQVATDNPPWNAGTCARARSSQPVPTGLSSIK